MANEMTLISGELQTIDGQLRTHTGLQAPGGSIDTLTIGQKLRLELNYTYDSMADGVRLYFNPWLFGVDSNFGAFYAGGSVISPPPQGYFLQIQGQPTATDLPLTIYGAGLGSNSQRNLDAFISYTTGPSGGFTVALEFFMISDMDNLLTDETLVNRERLLRGSVLDSADGLSVVQSVYNVDKRINTLVYLHDTNTQEADPLGSGSLVDVRRFDEHGIPVTARFYNRGIKGAATEMTGPVFTITREGTTVNQLSIIEDTTINFKATYTAAAPTGASCQLIRIDSDNDVQTWPDNYDQSWVSVLTTNPAPTTLDNHIESPSIGISPLGGDEYQVQFIVNSSLVLTGTYQIIVTFYDDSQSLPNQVAQSWISKGLTVTSIPTVCLAPSNTTTLESMNSGPITDEILEVYPQDRIRIKGQVNVNNMLGDITAFYQAWGVIPPVTVSEKMVSATIQIFEKIDSQPDPTKVLISLLDEKTANRVPGLQRWGQAPKFQLNGWDVNEGSLGIIDYEYTFRVRYEPNQEPLDVLTAPTATQIKWDQTGFLKPAYIDQFTLSQDWVGKEIFILVRFLITFDNAPEPFSQEFYITRKLLPQEYDDTHASPELSGIRILHPLTLDEVIVADSNELTEVIVEVTRISTSGDRNMVTYFDSPIFGQASLQEETFWTPVLERLTSAQLQAVDEKWLDTQDKAFFRVKISNLDDAVYQVSASIK